jgi:hypothetical protein
MSHRCKCKCCLQRVIGRDFVELQHSGLHDASSHENDGSKYLKHDQIVAVHDAAVTAPQVSGTVLRQNLQLADNPNKKNAAQLQHCVQRQVYNVRKQLARKQLDCCKLDDSFDALTSFFEKNDFRELVAKHNDPADSYHLPLFDFVIIGREVTAERDLLILNFSSAWMLATHARSCERAWVSCGCFPVAGGAFRQSIAVAG